MTLTCIDLFCGIGGFSRGLEQAGGFRTIAACETDRFASRVFAKHWPEVPNLGDVTKAEFPRADIITAGFPCQDLSYAGIGAGLSGSRSGLFWEVVRAVRLVRPLYVLLENVAALLDRGMGVVAGAMAESGYDTEWDCIPAAAVGAPCIRDRIFIVAYPDRAGPGGVAKRDIFSSVRIEAPRRRHVDGLDLAEHGPWSSLPATIRVDYGVPGVVERLGALGNSVVPEIVTRIGRAILATPSPSPSPLPMEERE